MLIRQITLLRFCTAVGGQQFRIDSRNFKQKLRLNVIIPFSVIVLSLQDAPKNYFEKTEMGGHKQSLGEHAPPGPLVATVLASIRTCCYFLLFCSRRRDTSIRISEFLATGESAVDQFACCVKWIVTQQAHPIITRVASIATRVWQFGSQSKQSSKQPFYETT